MAETAVELMQQGKDITKFLTDLEKARLNKCERVIREGFNIFLDVGHALAEIRDSRLYRETHNTFERYCKEVWDFSKQHAYNQIYGYETITLLEKKSQQLLTFSGAGPENGETCANASANDRVLLPFNEAQTRPLVKLKNPDDRVKAWSMVLENLNRNPKAKLTASLVSKAVKQVKGGAARERVKETKQAVETTDQLSSQFKNQYQVILDILVLEKNNGWTTSKRKAVVKWLNALVAIAEGDE
ncbi:MAG: hypothetical protein V6Z89_14540 [Desulfobacter sp.]